MKDTLGNFLKSLSYFLVIFCYVKTHFQMMCSTLICRLKKQKYLNSDTFFEKKRYLGKISTYSPFTFMYLLGSGENLLQRTSTAEARSAHTRCRSYGFSIVPCTRTDVDIKGPVSRKWARFTKTMRESGTLLYLSNVNCDPQVSKQKVFFNNL